MDDTFTVLVRANWADSKLAAVILANFFHFLNKKYNLFFSDFLKKKMQFSFFQDSEELKNVNPKSGMYFLGLCPSKESFENFLNVGAVVIDDNPDNIEIVKKFSDKNIGRFKINVDIDGCLVEEMAMVNWNYNNVSLNASLPDNFAGITLLVLAHIFQHDFNSQKYFPYDSKLLVDCAEKVTIGSKFFSHEKTWGTKTQERQNDALEFKTAIDLLSFEDLIQFDLISIYGFYFEKFGQILRNKFHKNVSGTDHACHT